MSDSPCYRVFPRWDWRRNRVITESNGKTIGNHSRCVCQSQKTRRCRTVERTPMSCTRRTSPSRVSLIVTFPRHLGFSSLASLPLEHFFPSSAPFESDHCLWYWQSSLVSRAIGCTTTSASSNPSNCRRTNEDDFTHYHFVSKQCWTIPNARWGRWSECRNGMVESEKTESWRRRWWV